MVCMIPLISITNFNSIIETEFSYHHVVCVPEQKSCNMRGYVAAVQIHIGFCQLLYPTEEFDYTVKIIFIFPVGCELIFSHIVY